MFKLVLEIAAFILTPFVFRSEAVARKAVTPARGRGAAPQTGPARSVFNPKGDLHAPNP
jgi:hypothetical protein